MTEEIIEVANTPPTANFSWIPSLPNDREVIYFSDKSVDIDGFVTVWLWDFGDGNISYEQNPNHSYWDNGNYTITLTVTDDDGALHTIQKEITITNIPPIADFSWIPSLPSTSDFIYFMDNSSDLDGNIVNYTWNFGDGNMSYEKDAMHKYADNGTYTVTLLIRDNDNATDVVVKKITVSNVPPHADFTFTPTSPKDVQTVTFGDLSSDSDGNIVAWYWDFGDGTTSTEKEPKHMYPDDGTYSINLTVTDDDGATNKITKIILVRNDPPQANFYYLPSSPTDLDEISFHDISEDADGNIVSWKWVFGDGNTSNEQNPTHRYFNNGIYTVKLTVTDDDTDSDTVVYDITIANAPPIANFSYTPTSPTDLEKITFMDNSSDLDGNIVNYTWNFGDGNVSYERNVSHQYGDDGNYTVTLKVKDDDGATASIQKEIVVENVGPIADFTYDPEKPRAKKTVTFSDLSIDEDGSVAAWYWDFGDGTTGDGKGKIITHVYEKKGKYIVTLTIEDDDGASCKRKNHRSEGERRNIRI
ncbi:MAG: PKD domain-containing protein [Thermoplasmata archaeon]|nr:MAG: PKD domain-containing protein [Thermoplasmata archaeon]